jgi:hypothetical protein
MGRVPGGATLWNLEFPDLEFADNAPFGIWNFNLWDFFACSSKKNCAIKESLVKTPMTAQNEDVFGFGHWV